MTTIPRVDRHPQKKHPLRFLGLPVGSGWFEMTLPSVD
jgi:hypothetical protein